MVVPQAYASDGAEHVEVLVAVNICDVVSKTVGSVNREHVCQRASHLREFGLVCLGFGAWELRCRAYWKLWLVRVPLFTSGKHAACALKPCVSSAEVGEHPEFC